MSFKEQRRFPRVQVRPALAAALAEFGALVIWPNFETSEIGDLSYKGFAVRRPGVFPVSIRQTVDMECVLGGQKAFKVTARMAWANQEWVGFEIQSMAAEGHLAMREYLEAKLLGSGLRPVERAFIAANENFQYWFYGPAQTHVYVWTNPLQQIERVQVDMAGQVAEFHRGQPSLKLDSAEKRALLVISQMDNPDLPMEEFVRNLLLGA